jgi:hypothetical protein
LHHAAGEVSHDGFSLDVKVAKHLVAAPSAQEANDVAVNAGAEESHGPGGTKRAGIDIGR